MQQIWYAELRLNLNIIAVRSNDEILCLYQHRICKRLLESCNARRVEETAFVSFRVRQPEEIQSSWRQQPISIAARRRRPHQCLNMFCCASSSSSSKSEKVLQAASHGNGSSRNTAHVAVNVQQTTSSAAEYSGRVKKSWID